MSMAAETDTIFLWKRKKQWDHKILGFNKSRTAEVVSETESVLFYFHLFLLSTQALEGK